MTKINCLIVDDEELARDLVENYCNRVPHLHIVGKCANPLEAIRILQEQSVDILFLDIQMPELTGIEFLKALTQKPKVIFTTAYKEYALEGYALDVVDYLLKPFRFERFLQALNKASSLMQITESNKIESITETTTAGIAKDYILVKANFKTHRIFFKDIIYIESMKEYVAYHTRSGRIISLGSLKKLEEDLPEDVFMRIHKSFIVNVNAVNALEGNMVHVADKELPIGFSYKEEVLKRLF